MSLVLLVAIPASSASPKSFDIKYLYNGENAFAHVEALTAYGPRIAGGPAERAAADYIAAEMMSYGIEVEIQEFPTFYYEERGSTLEVIGGPTLNPDIMTFSPSGDSTALLVDCGLGYPADFPPAVVGNIALMERGELYFREKTQNAADAGALAAIIYNYEPGPLYGTLGSVTDIPAVGISGEEGVTLLSLLSAGPVTVHLYVDTIFYESTSQNVIGTLEGIDPAQGIVYVGSHYDSHWAGPGANDDASGVGAMLEAARILCTRGHRTKATLKFIAFGSHETGLDGSNYYVTENIDEVSNYGIGMINLDMIGVGDTRLIGNIDWSGSALKNYTEEKSTAMELTWTTFYPGASSDSLYFEHVGVPAVVLTQSPDPWYHTAEDTPDKIALTTLENNGELATAVMYDWAVNPAMRERRPASNQGPT